MRNNTVCVQLYMDGFYFIGKKVYLMPTINMEATGSNIKVLIKEKGLTVKEIQNMLGFNNPQSIFKWLRGETMPTLDNLIILAYILGVSMDNIIITN